MSIFKTLAFSSNILPQFRQKSRVASCIRLRKKFVHYPLHITGTVPGVELQVYAFADGGPVQ